MTVPNFTTSEPVVIGADGGYRHPWRKNNKYSCKQQCGGQAGQMTQKKLSTSSEEGSEYRQQVWCELIKDLLRHNFLFGGFAAVFDWLYRTNGFENIKSF